MHHRDEREAAREPQCVHEEVGQRGVEAVDIDAAATVPRSLKEVQEPPRATKARQRPTGKKGGVHDASMAKARLVYV